MSSKEGKIKATQLAVVSLSVFFSFTAQGWWVAVAQWVKHWVDKQRVSSSRPSMDNTLASGVGARTAMPRCPLHKDPKLLTVSWKKLTPPPGAEPAWDTNRVDSSS